MSGREQEPGDMDSGEPIRPSPLPPELAEFLKDKPLACLTHGTDQGTVLVVKAPAHEIQSLRGRVRIHLRYELYDHPAAPVVRIVTTIYDQPERPLALESFINVEDPEQRSDFQALATQEQLLMLFYDEGLAHRLTKIVPHTENTVITEILGRAEGLLARIPKERFDFDAAKRRVMKATSL